MPLRKLRLCSTFSESVITIEPFVVVIASGVYHS